MTSEFVITGKSVLAKFDAGSAHRHSANKRPFRILDFALVDFHVTFELRTLEERAAAELTLEFFLSAVNPHVDVEIALRFEPRAALRALVRPVTGNYVPT